jgi:hypothetical protein
MFTTPANIARTLTVAFVVTSQIVLAGCFGGNDSNPVAAPPVQDNRGGAVDQVLGAISGIARRQPGQNGDMANAVVQLYMSYEEWYYNDPVQSVAVEGSGATVEFLLENLDPNSYFLDVWLDMDDSQTWSAGDYVGWFGTGALGSPTLNRVMVRQGRTTDVDTIQMYRIPTNADAERIRTEAVVELE